MLKNFNVYEHLVNYLAPFPLNHFHLHKESNTFPKFVFCPAPFSSILTQTISHLFNCILGMNNGMIFSYFHKFILLLLLYFLKRVDLLVHDFCEIMIKKTTSIM